MKKGYFQIYTGDGKGKTTAALGLAFRAMGHGLRTYVGQFMKGRSTGEFKASRTFAPLITVERYGRIGFVSGQGAPAEDDVRLAREGLRKAKEAMISGGYDIIVLDEIITAYSFHLVTLEEMLELAAARPPGVELVFTGRGAPVELMEKADLVTEMKQVKHPFRKGIKAQAGVEF